MYKPKLSCRLSQNSEYWAGSMCRVWRSKRWRNKQIQQMNQHISLYSPTSVSSEQSGDLWPPSSPVWPGPLLDQPATGALRSDPSTPGSPGPIAASAGYHRQQHLKPPTCLWEKSQLPVCPGKTDRVSVCVCVYLFPVVPLHPPEIWVVWIYNLWTADILITWPPSSVGHTEDRQVFVWVVSKLQLNLNFRCVLLTLSLLIRNRMSSAEMTLEPRSAAPSQAWCSW